MQNTNECCIRGPTITDYFNPRFPAKVVCKKEHSSSTNCNSMGNKFLAKPAELLNLVRVFVDS